MKSKFLIAALFISATFFAQDFEMGEVSVKELKEKQHPLEPSAPAAILFKKGTTSFDFDNQGHWILVTDVMVRLKIYNESGYKYANVEIPYYIGGGDKEEVEIEDAFTYNLINGKAERTKLTDESKFSQEVNSKWKIKKIAFPNVREGSVVEYHYTIKSPQFTSFPTWYFQYDIPVNFIEYGAYIPLFFVYNRILSPYIPINEVQENKKVTKMYVNTNSRGGYGQATSLGQNETGGLSFYEIRRTYTAKDVPSLNDESYVDNINNYRSFVKHELASAKMPNEPEKKYATDWNTVAKSIYESEDFGNKLDQKSYFEKDIDEVLKGKTQRNEIIEAVFNHVKNRMAWNGNYGYNCVNGINKAYEEKAGNVAEINLMLIAMLRYAGITANPILVSTRSNGHVSFVNRDEFNYVIAGVEAQNGVVYLDATSKNAMPDILPVRALNISGRIIRENRTSAEVSLIPEKKSRESTTIIASLNTDGSVTGQVKAQYYDYNAYLYREKYADLSEESRLEKLESAIGADVSNYAAVSNDFSKPVTEDFSFSDNNLSDVINGKIYISPMLVYTVSGNPFKQDKRVYPVDFVFPRQERYAININIPDGYTVESLPEPVVLTTGDNIAEFKFNIAVTQANQIQVIATKEINYARINPDYYETLKEFYNNMINKQTEKIVLAKK